MNAQNEYSRTAIRLHWLIAALILGMLTIGFLMGYLPNSFKGKGSVYMMHKSIGILILVLSLYRLFWRVTHKPPALSSDITGWAKLISKITHWFFYFFMIVMPLVGWALVSTSKWADGATEIFGVIPLPDMPFWNGLAKDPKHEIHEFFEKSHEMLAYIAIALIALHVFAAIKHHKDGGDILKRMMPSLRKK
ncbi:MAG: cytochrome b [Robiginitomaculum sp.]